MTPEQRATPSMSCNECGMPCGFPHQSFCRRGNTSMPKFGYAEALTPVGAGDGNTFVVNTALYEREIKRLTTDLTVALSRAEAAEKTAEELRGRVARLEGVSRQVIAHFNERPSSAPGHSHRRSGIWDDDAGNRKSGVAGNPCEWCATWAEFNAALADAPSKWLRDRLREERERAASIFEKPYAVIGVPAGLDPATYGHALRDFAAAIRALPEGE